jgi:hypothetical protein
MLGARQATHDAPAERGGPLAFELELRQSLVLVETQHAFAHCGYV